MAYLALYREWRPRRFADMVGQGHVTKTFVNALKQQRIAHAYLFSGPRGTGKTTAAKILAKALNCEHKDGVEPCNQCSSCVSIDQGSAMEVLEIDAASNRGIDEIRNLRENVKLSAAPGKYKVYIIDEVHMLTTEAFNALLKTLEEPPRQVVFILATTEVHKIPLTILSRVQRFEFHRIAGEDIEKRLLEVCQALGRQVDPAALQMIAQKSEGGLRDALSILDQCLLLDDPLGVEEVYQVLGMVGEEFSALLVDGLMAADYGMVLTHLSEGIQQGRDPRQILRELLDYLRQILLLAAMGQSPLISPKLLPKLTEQSQAIGIGDLLKWIGILLQGEGQLKYAGNARLAAELLLVQTIYAGAGGPAIDQGIEQRLSEIEQAIRQGKMIASTQAANGKAAALGSKSTTVKPAVSGLSEAGTVAPVKVAPIPKGAENPSEVKQGNQALTLQRLQSDWPEILENVRKRKRSTHAFLLEGRPGEIEGNVLTLLFREGFSFHRDKVDQPENRQTIEDVLQGMYGVTIPLKNLMDSEFSQTGQGTGIAQSQENEEEVLVKKAQDIFGAERVVVKDE